MRSSKQGKGSGYLPRPIQIAVIAMNQNWVTQYSSSQPRPQRFDVPDSHWLEMQDRLNRWGGSKTWKQLQQLGQIAKTD